MNILLNPYSLYLAHPSTNYIQAGAANYVDGPINAGWDPIAKLYYLGMNANETLSMAVHTHGLVYANNTWQEKSYRGVDLALSPEFRQSPDFIEFEFGILDWPVNGPGEVWLNIENTNAAMLIHPGMAPVRIKLVNRGDEYGDATSIPFDCRTSIYVSCNDQGQQAVFYIKPLQVQDETIITVNPGQTSLQHLFQPTIFDDFVTTSNFQIRQGASYNNANVDPGGTLDFSVARRGMIEKILIEADDIPLTYGRMELGLNYNAGTQSITPAFRLFSLPVNATSEWASEIGLGEYIGQTLTYSLLFEEGQNFTVEVTNFGNIESMESIIGSSFTVEGFGRALDGVSSSDLVPGMWRNAGLAIARFDDVIVEGSEPLIIYINFLLTELTQTGAA